MNKVARPITRPIGRLAVLALGWSQRYTVALWFRSARDETMHQVSQRRFDGARWKRLVSSLWRISSDPRLANTPELRRITLDGESVTLDAEETWHGRFLLDSRMNLTKLSEDDPRANSPITANGSRPVGVRT